MRALAWLLPLGLLAAGCSDSLNTGGGSALPPEPVANPEVLEPSKLVLEGPIGSVKVGDSLDDVEKAFPSPTGSFPVRTLPTGFEAPYRARGYEATRDGFAVILFGDRAAMAMRRLEDLPPASVGAVADRYIVLFGQPSQRVDGPAFTYRFWHDKNQRLMLFDAPDAVKKDRRDVIVAMGVSTVMDALHMSPKLAGQDARVGEAMWAARNQKQDAKTP